MKTRFLIVIAALACLIMSTASFAAKPIAQCEKTQPTQTAKGAQSYQLTARQCARLLKDEQRVENEIKKASTDGNLSPQEKRKLERRLNTESRKIKQFKQDTAEK